MTEVSDQIQLAKQQVMVEKCKECDTKMVNLDANQLEIGDLKTLKTAGVRISNPETKDPVCLNCHVEKKHKFWQGVNDFFESDSSHDDDDDNSFFGGSGGGISGGSSGGSSFGGFGGGIFSGGGASASW